MKDRIQRLSKKDRQMAERYGGVSLKDWEADLGFVNTQYYDKFHHARRSLYHQPNHRKHK